MEAVAIKRIGQDRDRLTFSPKEREEFGERIEVLDQVKQVKWIPGMECLTTDGVAEYFEIESSEVEKCYYNNKGEMIRAGVTIKGLDDFRRALSEKGLSLSGGRYVEFQLEAGKLLRVSAKNGIKTFPPKAVLRLATLLEGSPVIDRIKELLIGAEEDEEEEESEWSLTADLNKYACGSVWFWQNEEFNLASGRPIIVVSNDNLKSGYSDVTALLISRTKKGWCTETPVVIKNGIQSYIHGDQLHTVPRRMLTNYVGQVSEETMLEVKRKLLIKLALDENDFSKLNEIIEVKKKYATL